MEVKGYQGGFFNNKTAKYIVSLQKDGLEEIVRDMHVTFKFGTLEQYPEDMLDKEFEIELIGYGSDGKNSGFEVRLPKELEEKWYKGNRPIHTTVSIGTKDGVKGKPVDTAKLNFIPLESPIKLIIQLGYFVFGYGVCLDNSVFND